MEAKTEGREHNLDRSPLTTVLLLLCELKLDVNTTFNFQNTEMD